MTRLQNIAPLEPIPIGDKVAAIIAALPPHIARKVREDTERFRREARSRTCTWPLRERRRRRWVKPNAPR